MAQIRSSWTKMAVGHVKRALPPNDRDRVMLAIDRVRVPIRDAGLLAWLPAEVHAALCRGITNALGDARARMFWSSFMLDAFRGPLMRPILAAAVGIDGRTPDSLIRRAPRVWELVTRDCGELVAEREELAITLLYTNLAPPLCDVSFLITQLGTVDACMRHVGATGSATLELEPSTRRAAILARW